MRERYSKMPIVNQPKMKKFGWMPRSKVLGAIMQSGISILAINWLFQGVRGMQKKELLFRLVLEFFVTAMFFLILISRGLNLYWSGVLSILASHTCNWLFNTHIWVCMRYMKIYRRNPDALREFLTKVTSQIQGKQWISEAVCIGSIGDKGDVSSWRSDIDLRLFFKPGIINFVRLNLYLTYLRVWALFAVIPLDLYAYDNIEILNKFKSGEGIKIVKDDEGLICQDFSHKVSC